MLRVLYLTKIIAVLGGLILLTVVSSGLGHANDPLSLSEIEQAFALNRTDSLNRFVDREDRALNHLEQQHYLMIFAAYRLSAALIQANNKKQAKPILKMAIANAKQFVGKYPSNSEGYTLLGALYGLKILIQPLSAIVLQGRIVSNLNKALAIVPDNPRALMIKAVAKFQTPALLGGDKAQAVILLKKGLKSFENEQNFLAYARWGEVDLLLWLARCYQSSGEFEKEKQAFGKALRLSPGNYWVLKAARGAGYTFQQ